jgi:hypothetical protein
MPVTREQVIEYLWSQFQGQGATRLCDRGSFFEGHCAMSQQLEPIVMTEAAS